ncbi:MAG: DUF4373 domain-containing protein [Paenibacillaceae bacterium]|nr:DUF4373 domain-containing protein [Paenibacillaceae bacterium]
MSRPQKEGIDYFPFDIDFFSDPKIKILKARYGVDGIAIYLYLLCEIYRSGYYIRFNDDSQYIISDDLKMSPDKVMQVLKFLLERSLFDNKLFQSDAVLTSTGIQKRFQLAVKERAKKNPIQIEGFWILPEEKTEPFIKVNSFLNKSGNNKDFSGKNSDSSREVSLKESKVKESKVKEIKRSVFVPEEDLNKAILRFMDYREELKKPLTDDAITLLIKELQDIGKTTNERIAILNRSIMNGWTGIFPLNNIEKDSAPSNKKNQFQNFPQRDTDYDAIVNEQFLEM